MTLSFSTILLVKVLWLSGIAADAEAFKWLQVPYAKAVVEVEPNMDKCLNDGEKWRNDIVETMLTKKVALPLDAMKYQCLIVDEGGIDL